MGKIYRSFKLKISDLLFKLHISLLEIRYHRIDSFAALKDIWSIKDLDDRACCSGNMCGCYAMSHRDELKYHYFRKLPHEK